MPTTVNTRTKTMLPVLNPDMARTIAVRLPGGVTYAMGTPLGFRNTTKQNEVQTLTIAGTGSFKIGTVDGDYTASILVAGLTAAIIQAAVDLILGSGQVVVAGAGPYTITAAGELQYTDLPMFLLDNTGITGGPPTIAETTKGSGGPGIMAEIADGSTILAKCVLMQNTKTDFKGAVKTEFPFDTLDFTAPALSFGDVEVKYIVGLDATIMGQLGRMVMGTAYNSVGGVVRVGV